MGVMAREGLERVLAVEEDDGVFSRPEEMFG
jgi:hypothetical protein